MNAYLSLYWGKNFQKNIYTSLKEDTFNTNKKQRIRHKKKKIYSITKKKVQSVGRDIQTSLETEDFNVFIGLKEYLGMSR